MAFNLFKKKEAAKKKVAENKSVVQETAKAPVVEAKKEKRKISSFSLSLPHISEKAGMLQAQNKYVFKVIPGATKYGVRDSIEEQYGVLVEKVAMIRVSAKSIRVGKRMGEKQGYKKAVVTLKEGHKIEIASS